MLQSSLIKRALLVSVSLLATALAGCQTSVTPPPEALFTQAAQTVIAGFTQNAPTPAPVTPTLPPTSTQAPTATPVPTATPSPLPTATDTPEPTPTLGMTSGPPLPSSSPEVSFPTLTTGNEADNYRLVFQDDFASPPGWTTERTAEFSFQYTGGGYQIFNGLINAIIWSVKEEEYDNVRLEVDAGRLDGPQDGFYGLICRHQTGSDYYALVVGGDGAFAIVRQRNGQTEFLRQGTAPASTLHLGTETNHLRADCVGNTLSLYANGQKLAEVQDDNFLSGSVGMGVGTRRQAGVKAVFDNFELWRP